MVTHLATVGESRVRIMTVKYCTLSVKSRVENRLSLFLRTKMEKEKIESLISNFFQNLLRLKDDF